jgi:hypothetical protein
MASLQSILNDPNYVNANPATKAAIFDKYAPQDPNYSNANKETQTAIRARFGLALAAPESRQNVAEEKLSPRQQMIRDELRTAAAPFAGFSKGVGNVMFGGQKLVGMGLEALGADETGKALIADAAKRKLEQEQFIAPYKEVAPGMTGAGEFGGEVLATAPAGGFIGKGVTAVGQAVPQVARFTAPIGASIQSGGFRTGMATPTTLGGKIVEKGVQGVGGAVMGGTTAALLNAEDAGTGALIGAAIPTVAAPIVKGLAKVGGKGYDLVTGKTANVQASKLAKEMAGDTLNQIRAANGASPININAAQATADIDNDVWQAFLDVVQGKDKKAVFSTLKTKQAQDQFNTLAALAGGSTQAEAAAARTTSAKALNALTLPMQEQNLLAASVGKNVMAPLQAEAGAARQAAAGKVADVRRFAGQQVVTPTNVAPKLPPGLIQDTTVVIPGAQARAINPATQNLATDYMLGKLAGSADEAAGKAAAESLQFGQIARTAEEKIAHLAANGVKPLDASRITGTLRGFATQTGTRADPIQVKVFSKLADQVDDLTARADGILDVNDLYQIRKTGINDAIQDALGPNAVGQDKRIASLLGKVRGLIDDAIEDAGGKTWRDYLATHTGGMKQIEQMELAAKAMQLYKDSPKDFIKLVQGNNTKAIEDIFGYGNKDIFMQMGKKMANLQKVAGEVERDVIKIPERIAAGRRALEMKETSIASLIPGFVGFETALGKKFAQIGEGKINQKTMEALIKAAESGKNMNELLAVVPAEDRVKVLKVFRNAKDWNSFVTRGAASMGVESDNKLAPTIENKNALAR